MNLPNIILPPEMTPIGSMRAELIGSGGTAAMQDAGDPVGVRLLRELISVSKDMAENLNVLASIAKMQLEEAKKLAFALDEQAVEAARMRGRDSDTSGTGAIDYEQAGEEEKKSIFDNLPFLMFGAGGLMGALRGFFKGIGLTTILAVGAYMLGDDLNKYITELTGSEDMGTLAEYILYGTAASPMIAGALQGKKFAGIRGVLIGAVVGLTVGLANVLNKQVEETTGSKILAEISTLLVGTLGGAAAGFMVAGPVGAIVGAIAGAAVSAISTIYKYFTDADVQQQVDEEFGEISDFMSGIITQVSMLLKKLEVAIAGWFERNISDPISEFLGISTSEDRRDPRVQEAQAQVDQVKSDISSLRDQAQALNREAMAQPRTEEGRARADELRSEADKLFNESNRMSREDLQAAQDYASSVLEGVTDERIATTPRDTSFDFQSPEDIMVPSPVDNVTPTPSIAGQTAALQSAAAATAQAPLIISAPQTRGGDTYNTNMQKTIVASDPSNYDETVIRSMRNNYTHD